MIKNFILVLLIFLFAQMSANAQIPSSVSVKTSSYSIPASKWAEVYVEADSGGTFTINGVTSITTDAFVNVDYTVSGTTNISYTAPADYLVDVDVATAAAITINPNGNNVTTAIAASEMRPYKLGPGGTMTSSSTSGNKSVTGYGIPSNATNRSATFRLPGGTVINGSGSWRATVVEFNR